MGFSALGKWLAIAGVGIAHGYCANWATDYTFASAAYEKGDYATAEEHDRAALRAAESFASNDPRLRMTLIQLAAVLQARGICCDAEVYMQRALVLSETQFGKDSIQSAQGQNNLAAVLRQDGKVAEANRLEAEALATAEKVLKPDSTELVPFLTLAALSERDALRYGQAEALLKRARTLAEQDAQNPRQIMQVWKYLGTVYRLAGRFDEAEEADRKLVLLAEDKLGADTIDTANALANLGGVLCERKFYAEGRPYLTRAVDIYGRIHEDTSPFFISVLQTLSSAELYLGEANSAEQRILRAIDLLEMQKHPEQEALAIAYNNLGQVYAAEGRYREAEQATIKAKELWIKGGPESEKVATVLSNLGGLYVQERKYKKSEALYSESARIDAKLFGDGSVAYARDLNRLGVLYNCQKRFVESEDALRKALAIDSEKLGVNSPVLAEPYLNLGASLQGQRRLDEALESFKRGIEIMTNAGQRDAPGMAPVLLQYSSLLREMKLWADAEKVSTEALGIQVKGKVHGETYR